MIRSTTRALLAVLAALSLASVAQAAPIMYGASLDGPSEAPPNASPGTGASIAVYDPIAKTLRVQFSFSGLIGTTTAAHIHGPTVTPGTGTAGVMTPTPFFPGMPIGVTSGSYDQTFDLTQAASYNPAFVTANGGTAAGAEAALAAALADGKAYLNIHTSVFGGGEIRGFYAVVPEPSSLFLLSLGAVAVIRRRRRA